MYASIFAVYLDKYRPFILKGSKDIFLLYYLINWRYFKGGLSTPHTRSCAAKIQSTKSQIQVPRSFAYY